MITTMQMPAPSLSDFSSIGRLIYKMQPNLARELIDMIGKNKPTDGDFSDIHHIRQLLKIFCQHKGIRHIPRDSKTGTIYLKHVFLASAIKLYNPKVLSTIRSCKMMPKLRVEIAKELRWNAICVSQSIPLIIARLEVYEDFDADVMEAYLLFKNYISTIVTN